MEGAGARERSHCWGQKASGLRGLGCPLRSAVRAARRPVLTPSSRPARCWPAGPLSLARVCGTVGDEAIEDGAGARVAARFLVALAFSRAVSWAPRGGSGASEDT